jgi:hypothetical protein
LWPSCSRPSRRGSCRAKGPWPTPAATNADLSVALDWSQNLYQTRRLCRTTTYSRNWRRTCAVASGRTPGHQHRQHGHLLCLRAECPVLHRTRRGWGRTSHCPRTWWRVDARRGGLKIRRSGTAVDVREQSEWREVRRLPRSQVGTNNDQRLGLVSTGNRDLVDPGLGDPIVGGVLRMDGFRRGKRYIAEADGTFLAPSGSYGAYDVRLMVPSWRSTFGRGGRLRPPGRHGPHDRLERPTSQRTPFRVRQPGPTRMCA